MNNNQLEILSEVLKLIGDKLQHVEKEYTDYTIHNMAEWILNSEVDNSVKVKHKYKESLGEGTVNNIDIEFIYPVEVKFFDYPEYVTCQFWELEVVK